MNIVFLDFDGVLNTMGRFIMDESSRDKFKEQLEYRRESKNFIYEQLKDTEEAKGLWNIYDLDINLVSRLNRLVEEANVYFVISSSWRIGSTINELKLTLCLTGLMHPSRIIDKTTNSAGRGIEIHEWLSREENKDKNIKYAIIDDETCDIECYHDSTKIFKVETLKEEDVDRVVEYFKEG